MHLMHISIRCTESSPRVVIHCPWPSGLLVSLPTPFNPYNTMQLFSELEVISLLQGEERFHYAKRTIWLRKNVLDGLVHCTKKLEL